MSLCFPNISKTVISKHFWELLTSIYSEIVVEERYWITPTGCPQIHRVSPNNLPIAFLVIHVVKFLTITIVCLGFKWPCSIIPYPANHSGTLASRHIARCCVAKEVQETRLICQQTDSKCMTAVSISGIPYNWTNCRQTSWDLKKYPIGSIVHVDFFFPVFCYRLPR